MPKRAKELSALEVRRLTEPGLHAVGGVRGLYLQVRNEDARSWIVRVIVGGRRRSIGLGAFPDVPLGAARDKAREVREQVRQGIDPAEERRAARQKLIDENAARLTFDEAARKYLASKRHEWRNAKSAKQWESTLSTYASPVIGALPVADVTLTHIVSILEPLWYEKTETAVRLRGRIEKVLAWATTSGYRSGDNPARWRGHLDTILPAPTKVSKVNHHRALPFTEVGAFMEKLRERQGISARALEFVVLTAARSGEVRGATWDEIDLKEKVWTVPAERIKAGRAHRVPLSDDAVALLRKLPRMKDSPFVFPAARGGKLSDAALSAVLKRMEVDAVPHGFRSTFRDWCSERTGYPHEVIEAALAHTIPDKVERAYRRGDLFTKRTHLMAEWAQYCRAAEKPAEVVSLREQADG